MGPSSRDSFHLDPGDSPRQYALYFNKYSGGRRRTPESASGTNTRYIYEYIAAPPVLSTIRRSITFLSWTPQYSAISAQECQGQYWCAGLGIVGNSHVVAHS